MIIYNTTLVKFLTLGRIQKGGITIFPFIFLTTNMKKDNKIDIIINHEKIHIRQQLELLIIPFYILYFLNYIINRCKGLDDNNAYLNIIFEKEAYNNQKDLDYLNTRKIFGWIR